MRTMLVMLVVALLGLPAAGSAQAQSPSVGLKGGLSRTSFAGSRIVDSDGRTGFMVGAYASIPLTATLSIRPELVFSRKGSESTAYDYDEFAQDGDAPPIGVYLTEKTRHDYLEVPVLLTFSPATRGGAVQPRFFVGPAVAFLLGAEAVYDTDYEDDLEAVDVGVVVGVGVEHGRLSLDVRYSLGLTTIDRDYDASFGTVQGGVENRGVAVTAGIRLF